MTGVGNRWNSDVTLSSLTTGSLPTKASFRAHMRSPCLQTHSYVAKSPNVASSQRKDSVETSASFIKQARYGVLKIGSRFRVTPSSVTAVVVLTLIVIVTSATLIAGLTQSWRRFFIIPRPSSSISSASPPSPQEQHIESLRSCANAVIFSGARQGSTWFIDSIENCAYSHEDPASGKRLFNRDVFRRTELWKHFGEPHLDGSDLSPRDAVRYVIRNSSVKIFPSVFWRRRDDVASILKMRSEFSLSVLILRRDVDAAWKSWLKALTSKRWNGSPVVQSNTSTVDTGVNDDNRNDSFPKEFENTTVQRVIKPQVSIINGSNDNLIVTPLPTSVISSTVAVSSQREYHMTSSDNNDELYLRELYRLAQTANPTAKWLLMPYQEHYQYFVDSRARYDRGVERLLIQLNIPYDVFDYDEIREQPTIIAQKNQCWIRNCNFYKVKSAALHDAGLQMYPQDSLLATQSTTTDDEAQESSVGQHESKTDRYLSAETEGSADEAGAGEYLNDDVVL